jgi:hypothetical protein
VDVGRGELVRSVTVTQGNARLSGWVQARYLENQCRVEFQISDTMPRL